MKNDEDIFFEVALSLVKEAGQMVRETFNAPKTVTSSTKSSDIDLVTEVDQKVEKLLFDGLKNRFSSHKFIGEESASTGVKVILTNDPTWIIDPIDGTTNFVHKLPFIGICVGLYIEKQARIGIVYNPILDELYTARLGKGAFKNGFPIKVSETSDLSKSIIMSTIGSSKDEHILQNFIENFQALMRSSVRGHRSLGSCAINMCYIACGSCDAYIEFGIHCWDVAASGLIVQEAGGFLFDTNGGEFNLMSRRVLCAGTKQLAKAIADKCKQIDFSSEDS